MSFSESTVDTDADSMFSTQSAASSPPLSTPQTTTLSRKRTATEPSTGLDGSPKAIPPKGWPSAANETTSLQETPFDSGRAMRSRT